MPGRRSLPYRSDAARAASPGSTGFVLDLALGFPMRNQLLILGVGGLSIAVGVPLARRLVPRNRWYGLRIAATFSSEQVWYEANAAMGRDLIVVGCVVLLLALGLPPIGLGWPPVYPLLCSLVFGIGAVVATVRGVRLANRLLREGGLGAEPGRPR